MTRHKQHSDHSPDQGSGEEVVLHEIDERYMGEAMLVAREAERAGDLPIGAIIVKDGVVIARAGNARSLNGDPTAHAEIIALREAAEVVGGWRLHGCTLYVTLEPCTMCAGAIVLARVDRVVYAATDPKAGAVESLYEVLSDERLNHQPDIRGGVCREEAGEMLTTFFRSKRKNAGTQPKP
jgi:tRNA(adenine34) deaminase